MFNPLSLDYIYYPVSAIMWVWYKLFAFVLGPTNFFAWALSVVFLVFTLRAILYRPFVRQIETTRQMQELQPQIKALQKKYGKDRQKMAVEMQKLQKEHGFNPILGCLPMLAQVPVFLGLFHVLRSFNRTGHNFGELGLDPKLNTELPNYVFGAADVQHFLQTNLFGAPLGASMIQSESSWSAFIGFDVSRTAIIAIGVPLMIIAGIATHFNSRASVARQSPEAAANPQTAMMNKLALYIFPLGVVVGGPFLPLAIILYWVANNVWTYGQQHYVFGKIEKREAEKKEEELARRASNAPAPGAKPSRKPKPGAKPGVKDAVVDSLEDVGEAVPAVSAPKTNGKAPAVAKKKKDAHDSSAAAVFISHRGDGGSGLGARVSEWAAETFGAARVFTDGDSIDNLAECGALLVVVGDGWATAAAGDGGRALDDPDDPVRQEIQDGLTRPGVRVVLILADGARMPNAAELPAPIKDLAKQGAVKISSENFATDIQKVQRVLAGAVTV